MGDIFRVEFHFIIFAREFRGVNFVCSVSRKKFRESKLHFSFLAWKMLRIIYWYQTIKMIKKSMAVTPVHLKKHYPNTVAPDV